MSFIQNGCCFNLPRWEFSEQPLNPSKLTFGMSAKSLASVTLSKSSEPCAYAVGISDLPQDKGQKSASAAYYYYCQSQLIENSLVLLDLDGDKMWLAGVVGGKLWPSSDSLIQPTDVDYQVSLFLDLIDEETSVKVFTSDPTNLGLHLSERLRQDDGEIESTELVAFIDLIKPDQRSLIRPLARSWLSAKGLMFLLLGLLGLYGTIDLVFPPDLPPPVVNHDWKPVAKSVQDNKVDRNQQRLIESLVKKELMGLNRRTQRSLQAAKQLTHLHQLLASQKTFINGWDLKIAGYSLTPEQLVGINDNEKIVLHYQRAEMGQAQQFIDFAIVKQLNYDIDRQGNVARVTLALVSASHAIKNSKASSALEAFNQNGRHFFEILSRIQYFCYAWQSVIDCKIEKPMLAKATDRALYSTLSRNSGANNKGLLLSYDILTTELKGKELNGIKRLLDVLRDNPSTLIQALSYNYSNKEWAITIETHGAVTKNQAQQYLTTTQQRDST